MTAFGKDRPGIVADVSQVLYENGCNLEDSTMTLLADNHLNIVDLVSHIKASPDSGTAFYVMDIHIQIPAETDIDKISNGLSDVGEELNVDIAFTE